MIKDFTYISYTVEGSQNDIYKIVYNLNSNFEYT